MTSRSESESVRYHDVVMKRADAETLLDYLRNDYHELRYLALARERRREQREEVYREIAKLEQLLGKSSHNP